MRLSSLYFTLLICAGALLATSLPASGSPLPLPAVCGDCNGDGAVSITDAQFGLASGGPVGLCNVDLVGGVTLADALSIAQYSAGLVPVLWCPAGIPSISRVDPFDPACGTCITGVSTGQPFKVRMISNTVPASPLVSSPGVQRGASPSTMAQAVSTLINNNTNYSATVFGGNCLLMLDTAGDQAFIDIFGGPGNCTPGLGNPCFGYF